MTNDALWVAVGAKLRALRRARGYSSTIRFATAIARPSVQKTLDRIERGRPGRVTVLADYCDALGTSLPAVLREVLPAAAVTARAQRVAEAYDRELGAQRLVDVALGLDDAAPGLAPGRLPAPPAVDRPPAGARSRAPGRAARRRE